MLNLDGLSAYRIAGSIQVKLLKRPRRSRKTDAWVEKADDCYRDFQAALATIRTGGEEEALAATRLQLMAILELAGRLSKTR